MKLSRVELVASAGVGGTAEGYAVGRRTREDALDEIGRVLKVRGVTPERRRVVLTNAAARYVQEGSYATNADRLAAELLAAAGADLDEARAVWARRFPRGVPRDWHEPV